MSKERHYARLTKPLVAGALAVGVLGGSCGIATAASGSNEGSTSTGGPATESAAPNAERPLGGRRSDETALTGDALTKVTAAARAEISGGTIVRVETDADGHAAYEAHMTDADGEPVTVYVDEDFDVVSVERR